MVEAQGTAADDPRPGSGRPRRRRSRLLGPRLAVVAVAALGLVAGIGVTAGLSAIRSPGEAAGPAALPPVEVGQLDPAALEGPRTASAARSPEDAVRGFLAAEQAGDLAASFTYLSGADRAALGSEAGWIATHADAMPPVLAFEILSVEDPRPEDGKVAVTTFIEFEPGLDEFVGLVPARAEVTWLAAEDGGWGVELESRLVEPVLLPEADAAVAVQRWAEGRQSSCGTDGQWTGQPLGFPATADALCTADGAVDVGTVTAVAPTDATPFVAAFGGDVLTYLRAVPVTAPVPLRAVVAPIGDRWQVVGILPG